MCSYLVVEIVAGYITGSLALLADASHMFADVFGVALVLFAMLFSRKPSTPKHTYGFYRTEILSTLTNSVILLIVSLLFLKPTVEFFHLMKFKALICLLLQ